MTPEALEFLRSLPIDGSFRKLKVEEEAIAWELHQDGLVWRASTKYEWPHEEFAKLTYLARRELSHA